MTTQLKIEGMHCSSCVSRVEAALKRVPGVSDASVNLITGRAEVIAGGEVPLRDLPPTVPPSGFAASAIESSASRVSESEPTAISPELRIQAREMAFAVTLTAPVVLLSMLWMTRPFWLDLALGGVATFVIFVLGRPFFVNAFRALRHGATTMDTLTSVGASAAWIFSVVNLLNERSGMTIGRHLYFETGATIVSLVLVGRFLEARSMGRLSVAIERLLNLAPATAVRLNPDGTEAEVPASEIRIGDRLRLKPGGKPAVDGRVVSGESYLDESMLTGESMPIRKQVGDRVAAGTINTTGVLDYIAVHVGAETAVAQIAKAVERAQTTKPPVQRLADRISSYFVPTVLMLALAAFGWGVGREHLPLADAMMRGIAVLVISCPCALGLATPTAIAVGAARGAELGILIKDGTILERTGAVRTVLFDKTGTLTLGRPQIIETLALKGTEAQILGLAMSIEALSEHPIARAIVAAGRAAGQMQNPVSDFRALGGLGVECRLGKRSALIGSTALMEQRGVDLTPLESRLAKWEGEATTPILLAIEGEAVGALVVSDQVQPFAGAAVSELRQLGMEPVMVTGDRPAVAEAVAGKVGIVKVEASVLPTGKRDVVLRYQKLGPVAMVGDGINDAPALAQADLGIAIGAGTDIAIESADITLLRSDLRGVGRAIRLSHKTLATIRWNLAWAFAYNVLMIPLAALGKLDPMLAAGAMALSSFTVVSNSLRLRRFE